MIGGLILDDLVRHLLLVIRWAFIDDLFMKFLVQLLD